MIVIEFLNETRIVFPYLHILHGYRWSLSARKNVCFKWLYNRLYLDVNLHYFVLDIINNLDNFMKLCRIESILFCLYTFFFLIFESKPFLVQSNVGEKCSIFLESSLFFFLCYISILLQVNYDKLTFLYRKLNCCTG